jgi:hypothetical protein
MTTHNPTHPRAPEPDGLKKTAGYLTLVIVMSTACGVAFGALQ